MSAAALLLIAPWLLAGCASLTLADGEGTPAPYSRTSETLRVRILKTRQAMTLGATGPYEFQSLAGSKRYSTSSALTVRAGRSSLGIGNRSFRGDVIVRPSKDGVVLKVNGRRYRGILRLHREGRSTLEVIEELPLEEYLYGVLPKEVGTSWPTEALKAQAVISRTYAAATRSLNQNSRFDVVNTVSDQVYGGVESEVPAASQAVEATTGEVLRDSQGQLLQTFFHASCGGHTDSPEAVWPGRSAVDSFGQRPDSFCADYPRQRWALTLTWSSLLARLKKGGIRVRNVRGLTIEKKTPSGRAEVIGLETSRGKVTVGANRFRIAVGPEALRSVMLTDILTDKKTVTFKGLGWGHGAGLCQWGARGRALAGHSYREILSTYYPGATLSILSPT